MLRRGIEIGSNSVTCIVGFVNFGEELKNESVGLDMWRSRTLIGAISIIEGLVVGVVKFI